MHQYNNDKHKSARSSFFKSTKFLVLLLVALVLVVLFFIVNFVSNSVASSSSVAEDASSSPLSSLSQQQQKQRRLNQKNVGGGSDETVEASSSSSSSGATDDDVGHSGNNNNNNRATTTKRLQRLKHQQQAADEISQLKDQLEQLKKQVRDNEKFAEDREQRQREEIRQLESDIIAARRQFANAQQQQQQARHVMMVFPTSTTRNPSGDGGHQEETEQERERREEAERERAAVLDPFVKQQLQKQKQQHPQTPQGGSATTTASSPLPQRQQQQGPGQHRSATAPKLKRRYDDMAADPIAQNNMRRAFVKETFRDAWHAYQSHAWGRDELRPKTRSYKNWGKRNKGLGLTIFDGMTTLAVMGMEMELSDAIKFVAAESTQRAFDQDTGISVFETMIRVVGSLLSTFELTGERHPSLLGFAKHVADKLLFAFNTSTGLPHQMINLHTHEHWNPEWLNNMAVLSEFGSIQLEMRTLSFHLRDPLYDMVATHIMSVIHGRCAADDHLCPTFASIDDGQFRNDQITLGALGDSYFEYLLKQYILTGGEERMYGAMAQDALDAASSRLLRYSEPSRMAYFISLDQNQQKHEMDHLTCFAGGMFALASQVVGRETFNRKRLFPHLQFGNGGDQHAGARPDDAGQKQKQQKKPKQEPKQEEGEEEEDDRSIHYRRVAESFTKTCHEMYARQNTGLSPENVYFPNGKDFLDGEPHYMLRPETLESFFYLWRLTKDQKYREWAWDIFTSIREYCREEATGGYAGIKNVNMFSPVESDNIQQTFFLAETLKYLYLIFSDDDVVDLSKWVLNTEAHPLKIRKRSPFKVWTDWEEQHAADDGAAVGGGAAGVGGKARWMQPFVQDLMSQQPIAQLYETPAQKRDKHRVPRFPPKDVLAIDDPKLDGD